MPSIRDSVFKRIEAFSLISRAYLTYFVGSVYTLLNFLVVVILYLLGIGIRTATLQILGYIESSIFFVIEAFFIIILLRSWKLLSNSPYKGFYFFSFIAIIVLLTSVGYFVYYASMLFMPFSVSTLFITPVYIANSFFYLGLYMMGKEYENKNLKIFSILAVILSLTIVILGNFLSTNVYLFQAYFFQVITLISALLTSVVFLAFISIQRTLQKIEDIIINAISSI